MKKKKAIGLSCLAAALILFICLMFTAANEVAPSILAVLLVLSFVSLLCGIIFIVDYAFRKVITAAKERQNKDTSDTKTNANSLTSTDHYLEMQINNLYNALTNSVYVLENSTELPLLVSNYDTAMESARRLLELEQKHSPGKPFACHSECIKLLGSAHSLKTAMIERFMKEELYGAESLKTVKGKINRYKSIKSRLLEQQSFFRTNDSYNDALRLIDERLQIQEAIDSPKESTKPTTVSVNAVNVKSSKNRESSTPVIEHTKDEQIELDDFLTNNFTVTLEKKCRLFEDLYEKSLCAFVPEKELTYLSECISAYENAKECFYSYSEGARIYFHDNFENLLDSDGNCYEWIAPAYKRLGELQFRINCLYPYIKETAVTGFLQTDIYQAFPDHDRAELSKAIDDLYVKGSIQKTKKGSTYLITLAD